jgi:GNAT superfamily N-acetyltransferase
MSPKTFAGRSLGLQWIEPHAGLPPDAASIATFVAPGRQQLGIGSALFPATERAARQLPWVSMLDQRHDPRRQ